MIIRILRALFVIVSIFFANHLLYATDFYYLTTNNNIGASNATSPSTGTIGFLGETHPNFCYAPPNGYSCQYFRATLYALPPDGYVFKNWTGDVQGVTDTASWKITVTMDRNRTITANFVPSRHYTATTRGYIHASPLLFDINQDGAKEIIIGDMAGYVYCFDRTGAKLWEYYAGNAFNKSISPVPDWFNVEARNNTSIGNITIQSGCAAGDVDGDGLPDIICGVGGFVDPDRPGGGKSTAFGPVGQGGIIVLNNDGTLKLLVRSWDTYDGFGNPILDGFSDGIYGTPALADLDSDGKLDFVVGGTDQNIHAFRITTRDTSRNSGGQKVRFYRMPGKDGLWPEPIFEFDDDGDGKFNEDPVGAFAPLDYTKVTNDDADNRLDEDEFEWPFRSTDTIISSPAITDLNGDGIPEIIIGGDSSGGNPVKAYRKFIPLGGALRVLTTHAEEVGSFPQWIEQVVWSSPAVVDIDSDGRKEIFVGTGFVVQNGGVYKGKGIYAFRSDGSAYLPGKSPYGLFAATTDVVFSSPAIGDINGDGRLDIVAADFSTTSPASSGGYLYAWDRNGNLLPGFPMLPLQEFAANLGNPSSAYQQIRSSPILADIDGDGLPEIIIGAGWSIVAVNGDGTLVPEFRYGHTSFTTATTSVFASPAAADLDNNGKIDLVWATGSSSNGGSSIDYGIVHIWEMGNYNRNATPWPMFKRTATRTSSFVLQVENPVFSPFLDQVKAGDRLTVSVDVNEGTSRLSRLLFNLSIDGTVRQYVMADNGTTGDAVAGDGRYTVQVTLPQQVSTIGGISFAAQAQNGERAEFKSSAGFTHINIFNLTTKYYNDILDRAPEPGGAEWWSAEIERIVSLGIDVKEGFLAASKLFFNSEEYRLKRTDDARFVSDLYQVFLNRLPDQGGLNFWLDQLRQGLTRDMLITQFAYCDEFNSYIEGILGSGVRRPENDLVNDLYRGFLGRFPDSAGFNNWLTQMRNAQCAGSQAVKNLTNQVAVAFVKSTEYGMRNRDDRGYVEDLYNAILRRGADPAGFTTWVNKLKTTTREAVLTSFTNSPEFQTRVNEVIGAGCVQ